MLYSSRHYFPVALYLVFLAFSFSRTSVTATTTTTNANESAYCDCTTKYSSSLPNGSHCPNTTQWNSWTLVCDPLSERNKSNETAAETAAADAAELAAVETVKLQLYNYTAYNEQLYPLNGSCKCDCDAGYWVWGNGVNDTSIAETTETEETLEDGVTTVEQTIVTITTVVNNAVTETTTNTTLVVEVTATDGTVTTTTDTTVEVNITGDASGRARAWGTCAPPVVCADCLQCHNCLYIPSMSNFSVCVANNPACDSNCTKLVKKNLGVEFFIAACTDDLQATWNCTEECQKTVEYCSTDYCNTFVPGSALGTETNCLLIGIVTFISTLKVFWT